ncbi:MAG: 4-hydroxy-3-methylbut-2-enyl diphosphate reductase [Isosphaeraceae bacterium]
MRVIRADVLGMCFGVRDALAVIERIGDPGSVTIHGQLVHNEVVLDDLKARGFANRGEADRWKQAEGEPARLSVLITAHGISDRRRRALETSGKHLIDTTCPLVHRVHQAAQSLQAEGYHVLVIGRAGHVEVQGIVEDLSSVDVIESESQVGHYEHPKLGIVCQTTATERQVAAIRGAIARQNPDAEIRFIDTVCLPTKEHQRSLARLIEQVDAVVVVGGWNSNNTRELAELCRERGCPVLRVQSAADLEPDWFQGYAKVGLTAGTSTLDRTIDEVHRALVWIGTHDTGAIPVSSQNHGALLAGASVSA